MTRCKPCANPHDRSDLPRFLPPGLTPYVLNIYTNKFSPYHVTEDDVTVPIERLEVEKITSHRYVRGRGGFIAVLYETQWKSLLQPSWEREMDLQHSRQTFSATGPAHHCNINRKIGCIDACALVLSSENSHEIRALDFCLQATASSRTKVGSVASAPPSFSSAPTSGTRPAIITGCLARFRPHHDGHPIRCPLLGRPLTRQAQALSFPVHYGYWSGTRLVAPSNSSR